MINTAKNIDTVSDQELSIFQASSSYVRSGLKTMKKYRLGIWNEHSKYYFYNTIQKTGDVWDDEWVGPNAKFNIAVDKKRTVHITGLYDLFADQGESISVIINDILLYEYSLTSEKNDFSFSLPEMFSGEVLIKSSFSFAAPSPDIRELSFLMTSISLEDYFNDDSVKTIQHTKTSQHRFLDDDTKLSDRLVFGSKNRVINKIAGKFESNVS